MAKPRYFKKRIRGGVKDAAREVKQSPLLSLCLLLIIESDNLVESIHAKLGQIHEFQQIHFKGLYLYALEELGWAQVTRSRAKLTQEGKATIVELGMTHGHLIEEMQRRYGYSISFSY